jgi:hypothetical protein
LHLLFASLIHSEDYLSILVIGGDGLNGR